jgi:hypothetical protein
MGRRMMQRWVVVFLILILATALVETASSLRSARALSNVKVYFPVIRKFYPPYPDTPWLHPIDNTDGDGNYTVRWETAARAESYELEERWQDGDWFRVYSGAAIQAELGNRPPGSYAYRCRAHNGWGYSGWSNWREVNVPGDPPGTISTPSSRQVNADGKSVVKVINDCPYRLHLEFTGPEPKPMELPKCEVCSVYTFMGPLFCPTENRPIEEIRYEPGPYRVFVSVDDPSVRPYIGHWQLQGNRRYTVCFYIVRSWSAPQGTRVQELVVGNCD